MGTRRHTSLIIRAAVSGNVDFKQARLLDVMWHKRLNLILRELDAADWREFLKINHTRKLAYLDLAASAKTKMQFVKDEWECFEQYYNSIFNIVQEKNREQREIDYWEDAWEQEFGNINDPEVRAKIDLVAEGLKAQREGR